MVRKWELEYALAEDVETYASTNQWEEGQSRDLPEIGKTGHREQRECYLIDLKWRSKEFRRIE